MSLSRREILGQVITASAVIAVAGWAYANTISGLVRGWSTDPNYSHGFLVPLLAIGLLWHRARILPRPAVLPDFWSGLGVLAFATLIRSIGSYYYVNFLDHVSILLTLVGIVLLFAGRAWLRRLWPVFAVLVFILPIPAFIGGSNVVAGLQDLSTRASTFLLQLLGKTAYREGNVILMKSLELGVVEACSGLKMLMVFCALAVTTATLLPVGPVRKVIVMLSAIPLALACNVIRITVAGLAGEAMGSETGHFIFHDLAGWLMIPLAFALLTVEVLILNWYVRPAKPAVQG